MARKNRVSVYDGIYHITSRIANRAMLLAEDEVKDRNSMGTGPPDPSRQTHGRTHGDSPDLAEQTAWRT